VKVLVLMATFNGAKFLPAQIDSIRAQTHADWRLLARDDGSSDATPAMLRRLAGEDPRIGVLDDGLGNLGPAGNFAHLMGVARDQGPDAVAFADQDDLWEPDKLERQVAALSALQRDHRAHTPVLVHSDLALVDTQGAPVARSFMARQHIRRPDNSPFLTLLLQNHVVGCSMLLNRALLELATPVPEDVHMHDWWTALCAAAAGVTAYLPRPLVRYRQHRGNRVGAHGVAARLVRPKLWADWLRKMARIYAVAFVQAAALQQRLAERRPKGVDLDAIEEVHKTLAALLALAARPRLLRPFGLLRLGARCQNAMLTSLVYGQSALLGLPALDISAGPIAQDRAGAVR
jgi:rhamnosyltransferase